MLQNIFKIHLKEKELSSARLNIKEKNTLYFPTFNDSDILVLCLFAGFHPAARLDPAPRSVSFSFISSKVIKQSFLILFTFKVNLDESLTQFSLSFSLSSY